MPNKQKPVTKPRAAPITKQFVNADFFALPGFQHNIAFVHKFPDPHDLRNTGGPGGLAGKYKVTFTFSRPGFPLLPENKFSANDDLRGDSHLAIALPAYDEPNLPGANAVFFNASTKDGQFELIGHPNEKGFLAKVVLESFDADSFADAELKAFHVLMPAISNLSLFLDIPLHIYQVTVTELRTQSVRVGLLSPFRETPLFNLPSENLPEEFQRYASLYREGMNSNSPNYQFLCYYKIIEGLTKQRTRRAAEAKKNQESIPPFTRYAIPQTLQEQCEWLDSIFLAPQQWDARAFDAIFPKDSLGKTVTGIVQNKLRVIRDKIAHGILDDNEPPFSIDQVADMSEVYEWLPLTKYIARLYIKMEFPDLL